MPSLLGQLSGAPNRLAALRRFSITTTIVTIVAHVYLGLETSYSATVISVLTACSVQVFLEWTRSRAEGCTPGYRKGHLIDYLLPSYIVGMTCALFLFTNGRIWPVIFASTLAIGSKYVLRVPKGEGTVHFLNPSNVAILTTLLLFPSVSLIMPYSLSAGSQGFGDVVLPVLLFVAGTLLNSLYSKRLILVLSWFAAFILQGLIRHFVFDAQLFAIFAVATGPMALMFSFFMISDPGTTPNNPRGQMVFGFTIGALYLVMSVCHVVYGLFWALLITCAIRGAYIWWSNSVAQPASAALPEPA